MPCKDTEVCFLEPNGKVKPVIVCQCQFSLLSPLTAWNYIKLTVVLELEMASVEIKQN